MSRETAANAELRGAAASLEEVASGLDELPEVLTADLQELVTDQLSTIARDVADEAAREVLEFVRPRRHMLESHRFGGEDRRYLVELVEDRLYRAMDELAEQVAARSERSIDQLLAPLGGLAAELEAAGLDAEAEARAFAEQVAWAMRAFHRGLVRGGRADQFFDTELPRLDLDPADISRRIGRWWSGAEAEARAELSHGAAELSRRLARALEAEARRQRAELARRRRSGAWPLAGFATLAREWAADS